MYAATYTREPSQPSGGPLPGTVRLQRALTQHFHGSDLGIYNPRDVCGNPWPGWKCAGSQHARGAAGDVGYPILRPDGHPDGTALARFLTTNHRQLGVQEVIWAGRRWTNQTLGWRNYDGRSDHYDHVHYTLTADAAVRLTTAQIETCLTPPEPVNVPEEHTVDLVHVTGLGYRMVTPWGIYKLTDDEGYAYDAANPAVAAKRIPKALWAKVTDGQKLANP